MFTVMFDNICPACIVCIGFLQRSDGTLSLSTSRAFYDSPQNRPFRSRKIICKHETSQRNAISGKHMHVAKIKWLPIFRKIVWHIDLQFQYQNYSITAELWNKFFLMSGVAKGRYAFDKAFDHQPNRQCPWPSISRSSYRISLLCKWPITVHITSVTFRLRLSCYAEMEVKFS